MTERAETPEELPIACSLDPGGLRDRQRQLAELGAAGLLGAEGSGGSHTLRFRDDPGTRAALEGIVRAERECCPFLDLTIERADGELILGIEAPEGGEEIADGFAAAIRGVEP